MSKYYPPTHDHDQFNCPYCNVFAEQHWRYVTTKDRYNRNFGTTPIQIGNVTIEVSICVHCKKPAFWLDEKIIYPPMHAAPPANNGLPESVKVVYDEASAIANQSPRAACALLRLAIEILLKELGETATINDAIKNLVKKEADETLFQELALRGKENALEGYSNYIDSYDVCFDIL